MNMHSLSMKTISTLDTHVEYSEYTDIGLDDDSYDENLDDKLRDYSSDEESSTDGYATRIDDIAESEFAILKAIRQAKRRDFENAKLTDMNISHKLKWLDGGTDYINIVNSSTSLCEFPNIGNGYGKNKHDSPNLMKRLIVGKFRQHPDVKVNLSHNSMNTLTTLEDERKASAKVLAANVDADQSHKNIRLNKAMRLRVLCKSVMTNTKCGFGRGKCQFSHSIAEMASYLNPCKFKARCHSAPRIGESIDVNTGSLIVSYGRRPTTGKGLRDKVSTHQS